MMHREEVLREEEKKGGESNLKNMWKIYRALIIRNQLQCYPSLHEFSPSE